jgi:hypothetical protein
MTLLLVGDAQDDRQHMPPLAYSPNYEGPSAFGSEAALAALRKPLSRALNFIPGGDFTSA